MPEMIKTTTRRQAWMAGVQHLLARGSDLNLTLVVESPAGEEPAEGLVSERIDAFLRDEGQYPLHTVAETIFPGWEYRRRGLRGVFEIYANQDYPAVKAANPSRWGTYAHRMVHRVDGNGNVVNPLKQLIEKLHTEKATPAPKSACYELGLAEGSYDLPLYNTVDDGHYHMGAPCLSHVSFKLYRGSLHLAAFYRSHDYRFKALGNLLGLARLQACVAHEVDLPVGSLAVHSSYAWLMSGKGKHRLERLLSEIAELEAQGGNRAVVA